jgi:hypothetical protein
MAISYPLNTPTNIGIANITLMAENAVAISQSPFTFQQQIVAHPGQRWAASISLPPMRRVDAENWVAFLLSLKGQVGTFLLGDPNCFNAQGSALGYKKNLLNYTEQFDNAAWVKSATTITANAGVAPNGVTSADAFIENATLNVHATSQATAIEAGSINTYSIYVKGFGRTRGLIRVLDTATTTKGFNLNFDLSTQVITGSTSSGGTLLSSSITSVGNGWFRLSITGIVSATDASVRGYVYTADATGATTYLGDGVSGLLVWGAQIETGSLLTSYQPIADAYGPFVNGAGQSGDTLLIDGCSPNVSTFFKAGDYIQLGSGSATNLYKVLTDTSTNDAGQATVDLWPNLRSSPDDNDLVVVANTKGKFRLKDNITQWNINEISSYGITFDCVEAI